MLCAVEDALPEISAKAVWLGDQREYSSLSLNLNSFSLADLAFILTAFNHPGTNLSLARGTLMHIHTWASA